MEDAKTLDSFIYKFRFHTEFTYNKFYIRTLTTDLFLFNVENQFSKIS